VIAVSSSASSLSAVWVTDCGYGYDIDPSMPIERDGVVVFGTKNGLVIGLKAASGELLWKHRLGVTIVSTPVLLENRRIIISNLDGTIALLEYQP